MQGVLAAGAESEAPGESHCLTRVPSQAGQS